MLIEKRVRDKTKQNKTCFGGLYSQFSPLSQQIVQRRERPSNEYGRRIWPVYIYNKILQRIIGQKETDCGS